MTVNRIACMALLLAGLFWTSHPASAEDAISHPATKPIGPTKNEMIPSLAVLNSNSTYTLCTIPSRTNFEGSIIRRR
jgi:hypothetical protein